MTGLLSTDAALRFLGRVSVELATFLRTEDLVECACRLVVPTLADLCVIHVFDDAGGVELVRVAGSDTASSELAAAMPALTQRPAWRDRIASRLLSTVPTLSAEPSQVARNADPEVAAALQLLRPRAHVVAPLRARGRLLGAVELFMTASRRRYVARDVDAIGDLATRVALSLDNARLLGEMTRALAREREARNRADESLRIARDAQRSAEQSDAMKDLLLAAISHELRTPVSTILLWEHLVRAPTSTDALRQQALDGIRDAAELQARLVEDLLDVSRGIAGKLVLDTGAIDLGDVVKGEVGLVRTAAFERRITLTAHVEDHVSLLGDAVRLRQVMSNLLSNSMAFTRRGGHIDVRVERVGTKARLIVKDDGDGIDPAFLPRMFEPWSQGDRQTTRGLGIGLAIVRTIVELHGGTITAHSAGKGKGAMFEVTLPALDIAVPPPRPAPPLAVRSLDGVRVLVVDDDLLVRRAIAAVLAEAGAQVRDVDGAEDALRALAEEPPDVVLSDLVMHGTDGCALLRSLRERSPQSRLPAIAISAVGTDDARDRAAEAGFDAYLPKPLDATRLVAAIGAAVAH